MAQGMCQWPFQYLKGGCKKEGTDSFAGSDSRWWQDKGKWVQTKRGKIYVGYKEKVFYSEGAEALEQAA